MLACDRFVFVHLHKSGGTFINELMLHCLPGARRLGYHLPYAEITTKLRPLPVLGSVRNPLSYYVSWYHFQCQLRKRNALFNVCSDMGTLGFGPTITNLVTLHERPELVALLEREFPDQFQSHGLNLTKACIRQILGSDRGFYAFLYKRMYEGSHNPTILRMEDLRPALASFLATQFPERENVWMDFLDRAPDMNTSRHSTFADYYTADLRNMVIRLDAEVFTEHNY